MVTVDEVVDDPERDIEEEVFVVRDDVDDADCVVPLIEVVEIEAPLCVVVEGELFEEEVNPADFLPEGELILQSRS